VQELSRLAGQARVGGMLGGKAGIVNLHMGDATNPFDIIYQVVQNSQLPLTQFMPTHCNRNHYIFEDAKTYGKEGFVDLTTCGYEYCPDTEVKPSQAVARLVEAGVPLEHITMSSDACGSLPEFDAKGKLVKLNTGQPKSLFKELTDLLKEEKWPFEKALPVVTSNVADQLKLHRKGRIKEGMDADTVLLDDQFNICYMTANGRLMIDENQIVTPNAF
jgi:beta-aspartyl-dipeptidase (metallo-type)